MRKLILGLVALGVVANAASARDGERLSRACRREVVQLCGFQRGALRQCLVQRTTELSRQCHEELTTRIFARMSEAEARASPRLKAAHQALGGIEHRYGADPLQMLSFYAGKTDGAAAPLIIFVHGGGWKRGDMYNATGPAKISHFTGLGYHVASINYRLVPQARVEDQAADVASAIAWLRANAARLGIDAQRIVLMGHSAGAHLAALVGTDPRYLKGAGLDLSAVAGVVPIDGAAYDVPAQMQEGAPIMQQTYRQAFGSDPARQKSLSPYWQAAAPNAPRFLLLHADREDGARQSAALAEALRKAGAQVQLNGFEGKGLAGHRDINAKLGEPGYPATPVVDAWLKSAFGR